MIDEIRAQNLVQDDTRMHLNSEKKESTNCKKDIMVSNSMDQANSSSPILSKIIASDYLHVFQCCGIGVAVATMGGNFVDCTEVFCELTGYHKNDVCTKTIFNFISRCDLHKAFEQVSEFIIACSHGADSHSKDLLKPVVVSGSFRSSETFDLSISLVHSDQGTPRGLCVTLVEKSVGLG